MAELTEGDFSREKRELAKWRVVQAAFDHRACCELPGLDAEKEAYVRVSREELFRRLGELESLDGPSF